MESPTSATVNNGSIRVHESYDFVWYATVAVCFAPQPDKIARQAQNPAGSRLEVFALVGICGHSAYRASLHAFHLQILHE